MIDWARQWEKSACVGCVAVMFVCLTVILCLCWCAMCHNRLLCVLLEIIAAHPGAVSLEMCERNVLHAHTCARIRKQYLHLNFNASFRNITFLQDTPLSFNVFLKLQIGLSVWFRAYRKWRGRFLESIKCSEVNYGVWATFGFSWKSTSSNGHRSGQNTHARAITLNRQAYQILPCMNLKLNQV